MTGFHRIGCLEHSLTIVSLFLDCKWQIIFPLALWKIENLFFFWEKSLIETNQSLIFCNSLFTVSKRDCCPYAQNNIPIQQIRDTCKVIYVHKNISRSRMEFCFLYYVCSFYSFFICFIFIINVSYLLSNF